MIKNIIIVITITFSFYASSFPAGTPIPPSSPATDAEVNARLLDERINERLNSTPADRRAANAAVRSGRVKLLDDATATADTFRTSASEGVVEQGTQRARDISEDGGGADGGDTGGGMNPSNLMMGAGIAKTLSSLAFDAEDAQKINGGIDIVTGGLLIKATCPPPTNWMMCIYGVSSVLNGANSLRQSRKSNKAARGLTGGNDDDGTGGDDDGGTRTGGDDDSGTRTGGDDDSGTRTGGDDDSGTRTGGDDDSGTRTGGDDDSGTRTGGDGDGGTRTGGDDDGGTRTGGDDDSGPLTCDEDPNQAKCEPDDEDLDTDPCLGLIGNTCENITQETCQQLSPHCQLGPDDNFLFFDHNRNPIPPDTSLDDLGKGFGMTPEEIDQGKNQIKDAQNKAVKKMGNLSKSKGGKLKKHRAFSPANEDLALSADSANENFKPSLSSGGGASSNNRGKRRKRGANSFSRQLQSLLDKKKGHQAEVKKHGYKPTKLGNQNIGTTHDNIFDMMSRGYQTQENSLNVQQ